MERTRQPNTMCLTIMAIHESTRSQHALQARNMHNKHILGHNRTPPFLVQSSELIKIKKIACLQTLFLPPGFDGKHVLLLKI